MDLQALPEGCIATVISLTTPRDACRLSTLSRTFRSAGECDAVWDRFLPPETKAILAESNQPQLASPPLSKKQLYLTLCDNPVLFEQGRMSFSLDKWTGKKCYMLSARELSIVWGDTPEYWRRIRLPESRFEEVAELLDVRLLEICGSIHTRRLSPSTLYGAYLVFKRTPRASIMGLVGGEEPARNNFFLAAQQIQGLGFNGGPKEVDGAQYPQERDDGWLEMELGEFFCEGREDGELEMACLETQDLNWKGGLICEGIEIRPRRN